jgi:hypothetical protein
MSLAEPSSKTFADPVRKRWTGAEYDHLVDIGAFDHQRLELIEGEIFNPSPMNDPHSMTITLVQNALAACFSAQQYTVKGNARCGWAIVLVPNRTWLCFRGASGCISDIRRRRCSSSKLPTARWNLIARQKAFCTRGTTCRNTGS